MKILYTGIGWNGCPLRKGETRRKDKKNLIPQAKSGNVAIKERSPTRWLNVE